MIRELFGMLLSVVVAADAGTCTSGDRIRPDDLSAALAQVIPGATRRVPLGACHQLETRWSADGGVDYWAVYDDRAQLQLFVIPRGEPGAEQRASRLLPTAGHPLPRLDLDGVLVAASFEGGADGPSVRTYQEVVCPMPAPSSDAGR